MMTKLRQAAKARAECRAARNFSRDLHRATRHLDAATLKDIGVSRDEWLRLSYRTT